MRHAILWLALVTVVFAPPALAGGVTLKTDDDKTLYTVGLSISRNLAPFDLSPSELAVVEAGIADGVANNKPKADPETYAPKINTLLHARMERQAAAEKKEAESFLAKALAEKGAQKQTSGLIYTELKAGDGRQPKANDKVKVNYKGTLRDGTVFDSSEAHGEAAEFPLNGVIPCWTEGLQLMKEHGKSKLVCPSELAYADRGAPPKIKPGAPLVFEVELLEVMPGAAPEPGSPGGANPHSGSGAGNH